MIKKKKKTKVINILWKTLKCVKYKKSERTVSLFHAALQMKATLLIMLFNSNCTKVLHSFHFTGRKKKNKKQKKYSCLELHLDNDADNNEIHLAQKITKN